MTDFLDRIRPADNQCMGCQAGWTRHFQTRLGWYHYVVGGYPHEMVLCTRERYAKERPKGNGGTKMIRVVIESPYAGDIELNLRYLRACMSDCFARGEAPFASHGLYTQPGVLRDEIPEERELGIQGGFAWRDVAEKTVVYTDLGVSGGMRYGIADAEKKGRPVEYRQLGANWLKETASPGEPTDEDALDAEDVATILRSLGDDHIINRIQRALSNVRHALLIAQHNGGENCIPALLVAEEQLLRCLYSPRVVDQYLESEGAKVYGR